MSESRNESEIQQPNLGEIRKMLSTALEFGTMAVMMITLQTVAAHGGVGAPLDLLHLDLGLDLLGSHSHGGINQYRAIFKQAASTLAAKNCGQSLTMLQFADVPSGDLATSLQNMPNDATGSVNLIQEHTFGPAQNISQLVQTGTVTNMNGQPIRFTRTADGQSVLANGILVVNTDIALGANIIGHVLQFPLTFKQPTSYTADLIPHVLRTVLGLVGVLLEIILHLVGAILHTLLASLGLSTQSPLTFITPGQQSLQELKSTYQSVGPLFTKPAIERLLKESLFSGSFSPLELSNTNELTNLAGQTATIQRQSDGQLQVGEALVNTDQVIPTKNGFVYGSLPHESWISGTTQTPEPITTASPPGAYSRGTRTISSAAAAAGTSVNSLKATNLAATPPQLPTRTLASSGLPLDKVASSASSAALPVDVSKTMSGIL